MPTATRRATKCLIELESKRIVVLVSYKAGRRKKPEGGPLEDEARFRTFFERSADPMSLLDPRRYNGTELPLDITQRKQAEAELLRTLTREKELGQLRSKFVPGVALQCLPSRT